MISMNSILLHRRQAGEGKIGCIFWTVLLVFFLYVSWQVVPIKMKSIDLEQFMVRQAERASLQMRDTEKRLKSNIMAQADELDLPLDKDDLEVTRSGARIRIKASYTVPINLVVTTWEWKIEHQVDRNVMRI